MRGKTEGRIRRAALLAPALMLPLSWICWFFYGSVFAREDATWRSLFWYLYLSVFVLAVGYVYVALVHLGLVILRRRGWITDAPASNGTGTA